MPEIARFASAGGAGGFSEWSAPPQETLATPPPKVQGQLLIEDPRYGLEAGVSLSAPYATKLVCRDHHRFVQLVEGEVSLRFEDGRAETFRAGDCFVLPASATCAWEQSKPVRQFFVSLKVDKKEASAASQSVVRINPVATLAPSPPPAADLLLTPTPATNIHAAFATPDNRWSAGVWDATPYHRKIVPFPRYEFMHLLEGEVSFTDPEGRTMRFIAGDSFMVPQGAVCDWKNEIYVRKIFCVYRP